MQLCHFDVNCAAAARRQCDLTGKVANNGYNVTFSHKRNKKLQGVNLQEKKVYWPAKQRWVTLKLSTKVRSRLSLAPAVQLRKVAPLYLVAANAYMRMSGKLQAIKTIEKNGLERMAKEAGLDLNSLPFR